MQDQLKKRLLDAASDPYRDSGAFNYRWARGKLAGDPIFAALIDEAVFPDNARVLDLGCGRGLLAAWLLAAERLAARGLWSASTVPPKGLRFRGVELMAREADCGNRALQPLHGDRVQLQGGDMRAAEMGDVDAVAILDVLHYIPHVEQERLLDRIRAALGGGGVFVTRVGDAGSGWRFAFSQFVDRCISFAQGHRIAPTWCRPLADWVSVLESRGFSVQTRAMSAGTPFANVMVVARVGK
ncbi:methyltransferase domain-containing protein [Rhodocyclus tenuis]|uniref:SAM-dependent methyltransferase n=1 Tax=Rhodocyclus tenuis TaxID=1066 RepID=A0A840G010_RHOTE|nr:class I SAM-dependent methyltransferase [Rhodocyclus tenuis]MBB4245813.1 SAM-dependent methyltransferase [Rhodocyclus tenuis]